MALTRPHFENLNTSIGVIKDSVITINANNQTISNIGIVFDRSGISANSVGILWNEADNRFILGSFDGNGVSNISPTLASLGNLETDEFVTRVITADNTQITNLNATTANITSSILAPNIYITDRITYGSGTQGIIIGHVGNAHGGIYSTLNVPNETNYILSTNGTETNLNSPSGDINFTVSNVVYANVSTSGITTTGNISGGNLITVGNVTSNRYIVDSAGGLFWSNGAPYGDYTQVTVDNFVGDGSTTQYTLSVTPAGVNAVTVNYNGALLLKNSYSISGNVITFGSAPATGSELDIISGYYTSFPLLTLDDITNSGSATSNDISVGNITVTGNILPSANVIYDLGSETNRFRDIFLSGNTINLAGAKISADPNTGAIAVLGTPTSENPSPSAFVISPSGQTTVVQTTLGDVNFETIKQNLSNGSGFIVDTEINPVEGQALVWSNATSKWTPGNVVSEGPNVGNIATIDLSGSANTVLLGNGDWKAITSLVELEYADTEKLQYYKNQLFDGRDVTSFYDDITDAETAGVISVRAGSTRSLSQNFYGVDNILKYLPEADIHVPAGTEVVWLAVTAERYTPIHATYKDQTNPQYLGVYGSNIINHDMEYPGPFGGAGFMNWSAVQWIPIPAIKSSINRVMTIRQGTIDNNSWIAGIAFSSVNPWKWTRKPSIAFHRGEEGTIGGLPTPSVAGWNSQNNNGGAIAQLVASTNYSAGFYITATANEDLLLWFVANHTQNIFGEDFRDISVNGNSLKAEMVSMSGTANNSLNVNNVSGAQLTMGWQNPWVSRPVKLTGFYKAMAIKVPASYLTFNYDEQGHLIPTPQKVSIYCGSADFYFTSAGFMRIAQPEYVLNYTPSNVSHWSGTPPTTSDAIDRLAAAIYELRGNIAIP